MVAGGSPLRLIKRAVLPFLLGCVCTSIIFFSFSPSNALGGARLTSRDRASAVGVATGIISSSSSSASHDIVIDREKEDLLQKAKEHSHGEKNSKEDEDDDDDDEVKSANHDQNKKNENNNNDSNNNKNDKAEEPTKSPSTANHSKILKPKSANEEEESDDDEEEDQEEVRREQEERLKRQQEKEEKEKEKNKGSMKEEKKEEEEKKFVVFKMSDIDKRGQNDDDDDHDEDDEKKKKNEEKRISPSPPPPSPSRLNDVVVVELHSSDVMLSEHDIEQDKDKDVLEFERILRQEEEQVNKRIEELRLKKEKEEEEKEEERRRQEEEEKKKKKRKEEKERELLRQKMKRKQEEEEEEAARRKKEEEEEERQHRLRQQQQEEEEEKERMHHHQHEEEEEHLHEHEEEEEEFQDKFHHLLNPSFSSSSSHHEESDNNNNNNLEDSLPPKPYPLHNREQWCDTPPSHRNGQNRIDQNGVAVMVVVSFDNMLAPILDNMVANIPCNWYVQLFYAPALMPWIRTQLRKGWEDAEKVLLSPLEEVNRPIFGGKSAFETWQVTHYSQLLESPHFWQRIHEEYILIFQLDAVLCESHEKNFADFLHFDFVGAPWQTINPAARGGSRPIGNGGLSLRRKSAMLTITKAWPDHNGVPPEDVFFSTRLYDHGFRVPSMHEALRFSVEEVGFEAPLAMHQPAWKMGLYPPHTRSEIIKNCGNELRRLYYVDDRERTVQFLDRSRFENYWQY